MPLVEISTVAMVVSVLVGSRPAILVSLLVWLAVNIGLKI